MRGEVRRGGRGGAQGGGGSLLLLALLALGIAGVLGSWYAGFETARVDVLSPTGAGAPEPAARVVSLPVASDPAARPGGPGVRRRLGDEEGPARQGARAAPDPTRGALELVFRDARHRGVPGVEVVLLDAPPRRWATAGASRPAPEERAAALRRLRRALAGRVEERDDLRTPLSRRGRSDAEGRVRWGDLPAPATVRWVLVSEHVLLDVGDSGPRRASPVEDPPGTRLDVVAGKTTTAQYVVDRGGSVHGILDGVATSAEIRIFGSETAADGSLVAPGGGLPFHAAVRPEARTTEFLEEEAAGGCPFRVTRLRPGAKVLQARWSTSRAGDGAEGVRELHYAWRTFRIEAGRSTDLGHVRTETEEPLEVRIEVRGPDGERGALPTLPALRLSFAATGGDVAAAWTVSDRIPVHPRAPLRLHGLPRGRIRFTVGEDAPAPGAARASLVLRMPRPREVTVPHPSPLVLLVRVERRHPSRIRITFPAGSHPGPSEVLVRARHAGELWRREVFPGARPGAETSVRLFLPAGVHDVLLRAPGRDETGGWLAGPAVLRVEPGEESETWLRATRMRGTEGTRADAAGRIVAGGEVPVGTAAWTPGAIPFLLAEVETPWNPVLGAEDR